MKDYIKTNFEQMLNDLDELIAIKSVYNKSMKPFGQENIDILNATKLLLNRYNLNAKIVDNHYVYSDIGGGGDLYGIFAHLDVVDVNEKEWATDPYKLALKGDKILGRGVSDNKGSVISMIHAFNYLNSINYQFKNRFRLILGCDEERNSDCIKHYLRNEKLPKVSFTPDGAFPGIFGEKGQIIYSIKMPKAEIVINSSSTSVNTVCDEVLVQIPIKIKPNVGLLEEFFKANSIEFKIEQNEKMILLTVVGKAAHGAHPERGINAFSYAIEGLYKANINDKFITNFYEKFKNEYYLKSLGLDLTDDYSALTNTISSVKTNDSTIQVYFDLRVPITMDVEEVKSKLEVSLKGNSIEVSFKKIESGMFTDPSDKYFKELVSTYRIATDDYENKPRILFGRTYASTVPNCFAYGPGFKSDGTTNTHSNNEFLLVRSFKKQTEIYIKAIIAMDQLEKE